MDKSKQNSLILYRRRIGYSQKQVAQLLGHRDTSMLSRYENNRSFPPLRTALCLEIILRVPIAFLFPEIYKGLRQKIRKMEEELAGFGQQPLF
jgi:transcriptional regulator with XRE-family HTH domain